MGSTRNHEPLSGSEALSHTNLNSIFDSLDAAIITASVTGTAGETLAERDFVYLDESAGTWKKLDTNAGTIAAGPLRGCVTESGGISSSGTGAIQLSGVVEGFSGLTAWSEMYGSTTAGGYTQTKPAATDGGGQIVIAEMGVAITTTAIWLSPKAILYVERETLADNAELTIVHHADVRARGRTVRAYVGDSYDEPLWVGSISGDLAEVGVEYGDGSGSDQDTMTTFKNLTGGSADIMCIVEMV